MYVDVDLTYEDRKKQEGIVRWVKAKRDNGWNLKIGTERIQFKGIWRKWEEKEEIEREMKETEKRRRN